MLLLWLLVASLVSTTLAMLLWPLLRKAQLTRPRDSATAAIEVYRDQKRSLDAECASGAMTTSERDTAQSELARRVAKEVDAVPTSPARVSPRAWWAAIALLLLIPSAAVVLYSRLGNLGAVVPTASDARSHELSDKQIISMVESLAQRLKEHPEDEDGWILLARSYRALERFPEAADAYAHAETLVQDDPNLLADYADALGVVQGQRLAGTPAALIQRALAIDPKHRKALALAATVALEARDLDGSIGYWRRLIAELPAGSDEARQLANVIAEIETAKREGTDLPVRPARAAPLDATTAQKRAPAQVDKGFVAVITGRVDLASMLTPKVALTDTVFVFARTNEGPRMPLAVLRIPARELPKNFSLDDSMAMTPAMKLSAAPSLIVEARISKSGDAIARPGDLFGRSAPVKPGTTGLKITIDQVVP